jgi:DNA sulfur modification protein DndB
MTDTLTKETSEVGPSPRGSAFEYVFPAIRGVQAGHPFFVTMCPLRLIPRLFMFDEEELLPELRAQRTLNKSRVPEMARYILGNPTSYTFSALTASVDAEVHFESFGAEGTQDRMGTLTIPMSARFVINDGQHRRAAIEQALRESPELGDESIAVVLFLDVGLERCQQMFADLNRYAIRPAKSLGVLYDHREEMAGLVRHVVFSSPVFHDLVETEISNLSGRSRKLFTLSALYTATKALLDGIDEVPSEKRVDLARTYWDAVAEQFPEWSLVRSRKVTAGEVRRDFIHSHGIVLHSLGKVGNTMVREGSNPKTWTRRLSNLSTLDWKRTNAQLWEGRALVGGKVSKASANVVLTTNAIRLALDMPLGPEEQRAEDAFHRGEA